MQHYLPRVLGEMILKRLKQVPIVAILGPRQSGKTTLAKSIVAQIKNGIYIDLERPSDKAKLTDPEAFFFLNKNKLVCLDEIQRIEELFPVLRSIVDEADRNGQLLILGSASRDLLRQSSESLAGRISYFELTPFLLKEVNINNEPNTLRELWLKGGFPRSFLAKDTEESFNWRIDFIKTFLERDIPQLGFRLSPPNFERLWQMCAHLHGQLLNASKLAESIGVSYHTVRSYIDLLQNTFMVRVLPPFAVNLKKRLVKSPKVYIRDTGILHALLNIKEQNDLLGHPVYGPSWEGFVIENICTLLPDWQSYFYRTQVGAEIDLVLEKGRRKIAVECKVSQAPEVNRGFWTALNDLKITEAYIISPIKEPFPVKEKVLALPINIFLERIA